MKGALRLGKIAGIEINIHYTLLLAMGLFTWLLGSNYFPTQIPGAVTYQYWLAGLLATVLLFMSVLLHELAHSLVARARGLPVNNITLFILGGVSNLSEEPQKPGTEFFMALVGPLTSLILAGAFWLISLLMQVEITFSYAIIVYLAQINLVLGIFNLLPGFPLDGGRVLRSLLWRATGDLLKATNIAAIVGRFIGWAFIGFGVWLAFFVAGGLFNGIWLIFIGWFLNSASDSSRYEVILKEYLAGVKVEQVMDKSPEVIAPGASVAELVQTFFIQKRKRALPVALGDRLVGMVTISDVRGLPQDRWQTTPVSEIMHRQPLYVVKPEDELPLAMRLITQFDLNQVPVLSQEKLVGMITRADILNYLQVSRDLKMRANRKPGGAA